MVVATALCCAAVGFNQESQAALQIKTKYFVVTAPTSPNSVRSLQNAMGYMENGWSVGYIDTNIATNPAALDMPNVLRGCQICFGPSSYFFWDGTNNPTGPFAAESGSRLAWGFDVQDTNLFQVGDGTFDVWSSDHANTLSYNGNLSVNTSSNMLNNFGTTLRGQVWQGTNLIHDYYRGESITNPVTRVIGIIRVGYYCTSSSDLMNDLNYFKGVMVGFACGFAIAFPNGGVTNSMSTVPYLDAPVMNHDGTVGVNIEGQRQLGLYYNLLRSFGLGKGSEWTLVGPNMNEGVYTDPSAFTNAFYRVGESSALTPHSAKQAAIPRLVVENASN